MLRVTPDTNILISGLNFQQRKPFELLELARTGKVSLTVSDAILAEMEDVLRRKIAWSDTDTADARTRITNMARTVRPATRVDVIKEDPDDNRILECASAAASDYIISGDKDLLRLGTYDSISIVTVSDFIRIAQRVTSLES